MTDSSKTKKAADTGVRQSKANKNLTEQEKKALELKEQAEHKIGPERDRLQREAANKTR